MRVGLVVLSCLLIAGCAMQPIAPEKAAQYKRVGILSAMGDRFALGAVGIMVFGNDYKEERIEFGADDILTARASAALAARYAVTDLARYRTSFMDAPKYWPGGQKIIGEDRQPVAELVRRLMGEERLDAYILITPASASVRGTNQGVGGIGIVRLPSGFFGSGGTFLLHAAYVVSVVDGRDYSLAADMRATPLGEGGYTPLILAGSRLNAPNAFISSTDLWQSPAAHKDEIRTAFEALIAKSMPETLRRAELIGE
jgi:hypothetical protein